MSALADLRVVDLSTGIAGAYVAKMVVDAGADVVKVEPAGGDGMRRLQPALFAYLHAGVRSVSTRGDLVSRADLVIETDTPIADRPDTQVVVSITPYGRTGPWSGRPATEFTIQAECGSIGGRGLPGGEPFQAGGRIAEWAAGTFAAAAALGALQRAQRTGRGEHVDVSMLEVMTTAMGFGDLTHQLTGLNAPVGPAQTVEIPSIEPTIDGFVGFCTNSRQQFDDFRERT